MGKNLLLKVIIIGLPSGTLNGNVGAGGILLTPVLILYSGTGLRIAQATSSFSFLTTGLVGMLSDNSTEQTVNW